MSDLKTQKRWVVWNREKRDGKDTKVPYCSPSRRASSTDPSTWLTYDEAKKAGQVFDGIGIIFTPDENLLGIDIDHVIDGSKIVGDHAKEITKLVKDANTYTEISPSGDGLHLYLLLEEPLKLEANRRAPYEAYTSGRFFTWTENSYHKKPKPIRTISVDEALKLLALTGYPWLKEDVGAAPQDGQSIFSDEDLLERMFASSNGDKIRSVYDGNAADYANDVSRADAAFLNYLAFWTRKDEAQMERVWLASPLAKRDKTQKRPDYRQRTIAGAIKNCKQVYRTQEERIYDEFGIEFLYTSGKKKGEKIITQNTENICRVLRQAPDFSGRFRYDEFRSLIEFLPFAIGSGWRAFEDNDAVIVQTLISMRFEFFRKVTKDMVFDAINAVSKENAYDSVLEYVKGIAWDGTARLSSWLSEVYGVEDNEYHRAVGSNWLKGLVKRLVEPGCKFDYVLVLEGEQGVKKSTSLYVLGALPNGHSLHVETTMSTDSKDFFMQFAGKGIIEFSEGETLSRTEVKKMKAIITMQSDKYRPPYSRVSQDFPRRCVFAMTTNQDEYLKDETGNRRWLPVRVTKEESNIEWLAQNRDQLFAEAYHRLVALKETTYDFPKEETYREQDARRVSDPNEERVAHWYFNEVSETARQDGVTILQAYKGALNEFGNSMKKHEEMSISDIFRRTLKLERKRRMIDGVQQWRWVQQNMLGFFAKEEPAVVSEDLPDLS